MILLKSLNIPLIFTTIIYGSIIFQIYTKYCSYIVNWTSQQIEINCVNAILCTFWSWHWCQRDLVIFVSASILWVIRFFMWVLTQWNVKCKVECDRFHCFSHLEMGIYTWHNKFLGSFLKPAVWNYPTTVNNSEVFILLPKPCPLVWHLVCGNPVKIAETDGPKHAKFVYLKWHFWKFLWTVCSTTQSTIECMMMICMMSTALRCSRGVRVLCTDSKMCLSWVCAYWYCLCDNVTVQCPQECSKVPLLVNDFGLFQAIYLDHFLHDFHVQGVTLKGKVLATKCVFQNFSQLLDIFTQLILKTTEKLPVPSVYRRWDDRNLVSQILEKWLFLFLIASKSDF